MGCNVPAPNSRRTSAPSVTAQRQPASPTVAPDLEGVYRFRTLIDGCPVWYALNDAGDLLDVQIVRDRADETRIVADLVRLTLGPRALRPRIKLVRPLASAASMTPGAFVRLLRFPPRLS